MSPSDKCSRCNLPGHYARDCSLGWRHYRVVPEALRILEKGTASWTINRVCYNCAALDHFGDECPYERKRPEWTIFNEPDPSYIRMAMIREAEPGRREDSNRENKRKDETRRQERPKRQEASPNWKKLRQANKNREVTEENYYKHFDGSYREASDRKRTHYESSKGKSNRRSK